MLCKHGLWQSLLLLFYMMNVQLQKPISVLIQHVEQHLVSSQFHFRWCFNSVNHKSYCFVSCVLQFFLIQCPVIQLLSQESLIPLLDRLQLRPLGLWLGTAVLFQMHCDVEDHSPMVLMQ